jgi:hypothetical protein
MGMEWWSDVSSPAEEARLLDDDFSTAEARCSLMGQNYSLMA